MTAGSRLGLPARSDQSFTQVVSAAHRMCALDPPDWYAKRRWRFYKILIPNIGTAHPLSAWSNQSAWEVVLEDLMICDGRLHLEDEVPGLSSGWQLPLGHPKNRISDHYDTICHLMTLAGRKDASRAPTPRAPKPNLLYSTPMRPITLFVRGVDRLTEIVYAAVRWLTLAMILVGAFNAIARYLTRWTGVSLSSNAYFDLQWQMFSLVFLFGAAYALRADAHVRVDAVYARIAHRTRLWIDLVGHLLFLIPFCILLLVTTYPAVRNSWAVREASTDPGGLVRYPIKTAILVAASLLLLQAISEVLKKGAALRGRPIEGAPSAAEAVGDSPHPDADHTPVGGI